MKLVPIIPTEAQLKSMAVRSDHGLGIDGFYDSELYQNMPNAVSHAKRLEGVMRNMRQLYEEAIREGFFRIHNSEANTQESDLESVPDADSDWRAVTQGLLDSQAEWLYKPLWITLKSGEVVSGKYEWRQGRRPDQFDIEGGETIWAFEAAFAMPLIKPVAPH